MLASAKNDCQTIEFAELNSFNKADLINLYCTNQMMIKLNRDFLPQFEVLGDTKKVEATFEQNEICREENRRINKISTRKYKKEFSMDTCKYAKESLYKDDFK